MAGDMEQLRSRSKAFLRMAADFLWRPRSPVSRERGLGKGPFAPHEFRHIQGNRVVLIDDVRMTGATLSACTRALNKAGARHVDVLMLARVVPETDVTI